jgi:hypothetical protein
VGRLFAAKIRGETAPGSAACFGVAATLQLNAMLAKHAKARSARNWTCRFAAVFQFAQLSWRAWRAWRFHRSAAAGGRCAHDP